MKNINDIPVVKTFVHNSKFYVYDTYTNTLMNISENDYMSVKELLSIGISNYIKKHQSDDSIKLLIDRGYFKANFINSIESMYNNDYKDFLKRNIDNVILQVTQECNFKCRYCSFATDNDIERNHEKIQMNWEIAKESIDFLYKHSSNVEKVTISFYGGEPLLNFPIIQKSVVYAEKLFKTKRIKYVMTINGSLLTDDIVDFISSYDFNISISFDGYESIQNKHRLFADNGKGSFDAVYSKVKRFKERYPSYFDEHIFIHSVLFNDESRSEVIDYFSEAFKMQKEKINVQAADLKGVDYILSNYGHYNTVKSELEETIRQRDDDVKLFSFIDKSIIKGAWHHNGPCIPGRHRLFVDVAGNFYPCEKCINDKYLSIGNLQDGFDFKKIYEYLNIGLLTNEECQKCWCSRLCDICAIRCYDVEKSEFSRDTKLRICDSEKQRSLEFLKTYVSKEEEGI